MGLWGKFKIPSTAGGVAEVELLPSKCEALSSNPSTAKKRSKLYLGIPFMNRNHTPVFYWKHFGLHFLVTYSRSNPPRVNSLRLMAFFIQTPVP
jgi:hypothetical protein